MLYVDNDNKIRLTRGDTARISVNITNTNSDLEYNIKDTDTIVLTVKNTVDDKNFLFQKIVTNNSIIHILPEDTENIPFGKYVYDIELRTESGDVYTIIEPTSFRLLSEVTY